ncbi:nuclear transport factor 2 family protein [Myxococcota bacterium]|nr:nuclear transport factor 2 family protein [Myxococcota bacterium]
MTSPQERLERDLAEFRDREAIRDLPSRYCQAAANSDGQAIVALFTDDGCLENNAIPSIDRPASRAQGREELEVLFARATGSMRLRPFTHNHLIELHGDRATGWCTVEIRAVEDGVSYNAAGHYEDTYRRDAGTWKFERRELSIHHWVPAGESWA